MTAESRKFVERCFQSVLVGLIGGATAGPTAVVVHNVVEERRASTGEVDQPQRPRPIERWKTNGVITPGRRPIGATVED